MKSPSAFHFVACIWSICAAGPGGTNPGIRTDSERDPPLLSPPVLRRYSYHDLKESVSMPSSRAVYTVLLGGYERLNEQPLVSGSELPFICFTDDESLRSDTWEIRVVTPAFPLDLVRSQRDIKIRGHASLNGFDQTLYIDNSVTLKVLPEEILDEWLATADLAICEHSYRERVIDEFDEVIALNYDDPARVSEQLLQYAELYPDVLHQKPFWNALIARRRSPRVQETMETWYEHVLRFSRRDQLSANVAFSIGAISVKSIPVDNWDSEYHSWPAEVGRKTHLGLRTQRRTGPLLAEVARLERALSAGNSLRDIKHEEMLRSERRADELQVSLTLKDQEYASLQGAQTALLAQLDEMRSSSSWRYTKPARVLAELFHRRGADH